jgi:hypothetical protein
MLQLVSRALTDDAFALDGPAKKPGHREWLAIAVVAMAAFAQTGFARGYTPAGYFAAVLAVVGAVYLRSRFALYPLPIVNAFPSYMSAARTGSTEVALSSWLDLDLGGFGPIKPGSAEAAMHFELGTLSRQRLLAML